MHGAIEGGVAQHVPDLQDAPTRLGGLDQGGALLGTQRHRLLQQHVVAGAQGGQRGLRVQVVRRRHDGGRRAPRRGEQLGPVAQGLGRRDPVSAREDGASLVVRLGEGDHAHAVGVLGGVASEHVPAAVARAHQYDLEWQCQGVLLGRGMS